MWLTGATVRENRLTVQLRFVELFAGLLAQCSAQCSLQQRYAFMHPSTESCEDTLRIFSVRVNRILDRFSSDLLKHTCRTHQLGATVSVGQEFCSVLRPFHVRASRAVILLYQKSFPISSAVPVLGAVEDFNTKTCESTMPRIALRAFKPDSRWLFVVAATQFLKRWRPFLLAGLDHASRHVRCRRHLRFECDEGVWCSSVLQTHKGRKLLDDDGSSSRQCQFGMLPLCASSS